LLNFLPFLYKVAPLIAEQLAAVPA